MRHFAAFFAHLKSLGFAPGTVIDVGVASHTKDLYEAYPSAYFILVEPLVEFEPKMKQTLARYRGEYHLCALSDSDRTERFFVNNKQLEGSTLCYDGIPASDPRLRDVPVRTLDSLLEGRTLQGPLLIKTDVQGQDLNVVRGATRTLQDTEVVILEIPMFGPWGGGDEFTDYVKVMEGLGFVAYDVIGYLTRPYDAALSHLDVVFVKRAGKFRAHKRFN
jgi:FkbM family methyltransferase|uniref:FkbM family methyltransferase n=1 Tax=uncultured bacterium lac146 TaxID=1447238 RepID=X2LC94_9BACT|nr:FkbM family methyltransferase [uncultured bacterium lac146]